MNIIDFSILLTNISEEHIEEADNYYREGIWIKKVAGNNGFKCAVVIMLMMILVLSRIIEPGISKTALTVTAEEMGKEIYDIGVALPEIVFSDDKKVILYDYRGIYVYDYLYGKLVGFADFRERGMTQIQGDNPTIVKVLGDGKYVKFFNDTAKYVFDTEKNKVSEVDSYKKLDSKYKLYEIQRLNSDDENAISEKQITYLAKKGILLTVLVDYDGVDEDGIIKYKDLIIIKRTNGVDFTYRLFGQK